MVASNLMAKPVRGVALVERPFESLIWIANRPPVAEIGPRVGGEVVA